jgi:hypothetical protein
MATLRLNRHLAILQTSRFPLQSNLLGCVALSCHRAPFPGAPAE